MVRKVVKFGGTSVGDGEKVRNAARSVVKEVERGHEMVVVVSAMGKTTNALLEALEKSTEGKYTPQMKDDIAAMGVKAQYVEPTQKEWPVITNSRYTNAAIDLEATKTRAKQHIEPLIKQGIVPVMCGFLGVDKMGNVTTIGRGGSDTTGVLMGNALDADEVVIVTDVDGVYSGDPRVVDGAKLIKSIDVSVLWDLAVAGAKVMKWDSLLYKGKHQVLKVVNNAYMDLSVEGTKIVGEFMETTVKKLGKALGSVTVAGKDLIEYVGLLAKTSKQLGEAGINIWGVTVAPDSMTFFIEEESVEKATKVLHEFVLHDAKAVSVTSSKGIGLVYVTSSSFLDEPGALGRITGAIAEAKLNIKEVTTSKSQIMVFVDYKDIDTVYEIVNLLYRKKK
jgi:aspartate kinase